MATKTKGIRVSQVIADEAHVEIPVSEGSLNVWYKPSAYSGRSSGETDRYLEQIIEEAGGRVTEFDQIRHVFAHGLAQILTTWDLLDDDGNPIVLDAKFEQRLATLLDVPIPILKLVRQSINLHFFQSMIGGLPTSNGSSPEAEAE